ncbi:MAG: CCA tRNA nucleotidyltransferase [Negativicutes bacterium]|nr:CCA tRNA nucleotidyltransferase [Negativicutes bacterium]
MILEKEKFQKEHPGIYEVWEYLEQLKVDAVLVGGAVRDLLLGASPTDFDLASSLTPEELLEIAKKKNWQANAVGSAFGVLVLTVQNESLEIATFRKEGYGSDPHRPAWVEYGASLEEDLSRRDFTINGMALTWNGELIDPFGGKKDLENKLIRTIGEPLLRFTEDPLRLLRAIRFAAKLGFVIEDQTLNEIGKSAYQIERLAQERITQEMELILLLPRASQGLDLLGISGVGRYIFGEHWPGRNQWTGLLARLLAIKVLRWAVVAWGLGKQAIRMKGLDLVTQKQAIWIAEKSEEEWQGTETLSQWSASFADKKEFEKMLEYFWQFREALGDKAVASKRAEARKLLDQLPFFRSDLSIRGDEITSIVGQGPQVAKVSAYLLKGVQQNQIKNDEKSLEEAVNFWWKEKRV